MTGPEEVLRDWINGGGGRGGRSFSKLTDLTQMLDSIALAVIINQHPAISYRQYLKLTSGMFSQQQFSVTSEPTEASE